jgi:hypothetical protein
MHQNQLQHTHGYMACMQGNHLSHKTTETCRLLIRRELFTTNIDDMIMHQKVGARFLDIILFSLESKIYMPMHGFYYH